MLKTIGHEKHLEDLFNKYISKNLANSILIYGPKGIGKRSFIYDLIFKIISNNSVKTAIQLLEGVVENGTADNIKHSNYKIAGKTGTAKKVMNGKYVNRYYTSFVGFFPSFE